MVILYLLLQKFNILQLNFYPKIEFFKYSIRISNLTTTHILIYYY